jgi:nucleotide-binding universal stress UspA family protein
MEADRERGHIVVGVDGSTESEHALRWAVDEAHARHLDLDVVHAWNQPVSVYPADLYADPDAYRVAGARLLAHALATVDDSQSETRITSRLVQEDAAGALLDAARDAALLVVGSRGRGGFTGLLLGSVSRTCLHLASSPLVVVPPMWTRRPTHRIVVGVDGSEPSREALHWAIAEAGAHDARLQVVNAYDLAPLIPLLGAPMPPDSGLLDKSSLALLEEMTAVAPGAPGVDIDLVTANGSPAHTLLDAAADADLLVVGARGLGGLRRLLVGSVSQQCVHHSTCPVAVVHARAARDPDEGREVRQQV